MRSWLQRRNGVNAETKWAQGIGGGGQRSCRLSCQGHGGGGGGRGGQVPHQQQEALDGGLRRGASQSDESLLATRRKRDHERGTVWLAWPSEGADKGTVGDTSQETAADGIE